MRAPPADSRSTTSNATRRSHADVPLLRQAALASHDRSRDVAAVERVSEARAPSTDGSVLSARGLRLRRVLPRAASGGANAGAHLLRLRALFVVLRLVAQTRRAVLQCDDRALRVRRGRS